MSASIRILPPAKTEGIDSQPSVGFNRWVDSARPGSMFLDSAERLYLMGFFQHHVISEPQIKTALIHRERQIVRKVKQSQKVIRVLFGYSAVVTLLLIAAVIQ